MKLLCAALCLSVLFQDCVAPPVTANKKEDSKDNEVDGAEHKGADWDVGLEYNRYLQEVVQALESDPQFRDKLEKAEVADIRTGKIASELEFVNHNVRSKLDELKRTELERLRHLAIKQAELQRQQEQHHEQEGDGVDPGHVDHENPHTFEVEDLKKLIVKTTKDLEEADRKRREEFKEYEMQKEFEKQQQLNLLDEQHKKEMEQKIKEQEEKHRQHPNLNHPGSKHQLEEVWEEQDHMNPEDFNPKTFFYLHDLDGNGYWDADEVKALFQKELDKMYDPNAPEDDMRERREEMERMREHVFNETDVNRDRLISYQEFLDQTKKQEFEQDQGWESLDKDKVYTHEEYEQFEKRRQAEIQQMVQQGLLPPAPDLHLPYGMQVPPEYLQQQHQQNLQYQQQHHQIPPHAQQQYHPQGVPMHPNQVPQYHGGAPPQGYHPPPAYQHQQGYQPPAPQAFHAQHPNNVPQGHQPQHPNDIPLQGHVQGHPNMPPQGHPQQGHPPPQQHPNIQGHPNMPPQGHPQQGHPPPQQGHPNIPPQQGHPNIPPPQQGHPNIPPQGQHPNIPPQQGHPNIPPPQQGHPNIPAQNHPNNIQGHPANPPQVSQEHQNVPVNQNVPVHHNSQEPAAPVHHNSEPKHDSKEQPSHN